jgi:prophage regulatory protein
VAKLATVSIADAKALAAEWEAQYEEHQHTASIADRFKDATPPEVIRMWQSGRNERGHKLTQFEFTALIERWCELFRALPPNGDDAIPDVAATPVEPEPEDDAMLQKKEVARIAGVSSSTIDRMVKDGSFPKPMHLSRRRIGWPSREVKEWLNRLDDQRRATRQ